MGKPRNYDSCGHYRCPTCKLCPGCNGMDRIEKRHLKERVNLLLWGQRKLVAMLKRILKNQPAAVTHNRERALKGDCLCRWCIAHRMVFEFDPRDEVPWNENPKG